MTDYDVEFELDPQVRADMAHRGLVDALAELSALDPRYLDRELFGDAIITLYDLREIARRAQT